MGRTIKYRVCTRLFFHVPKRLLLLCFLMHCWQAQEEGTGERTKGRQQKRDSRSPRVFHDFVSFV